MGLGTLPRTFMHSAAVHLADVPDEEVRGGGNPHMRVLLEELVLSPTPGWKVQEWGMGMGEHSGV